MWHYEFESLVVLKNNRGVEDNRVRHLDYGVQINGYLYQRLIDNKHISFFSPNEVPGLYDAFFADQEKFAELYEKYEADTSIRRKTLPALQAFTMLMKERIDTGRIYIMNVDHCNTHSPFLPEKAPVQQSNLCVHGETLILTDKGEVAIQDVVGTIQNVWNGEEFTSAQVEMTNDSAKLIAVETTQGNVLRCTPYHKFWVKDETGVYVEKPASELVVGDVLMNVESWPEGYEGVVDDNIKAISEVEGEHATYCFHEPKRNLGVFNGILTGQCVEIALPTRPMENILDENGQVALCTLAGINLGEISSVAEIEPLSDILVRALDEILDYQDYPVPAARTSTELYRPLGIGVINYAYFLAKNGFNYSSPDGNNLTHEVFEALAYFTLKASAELAVEKGKCAGYEDTRLSKGILPIDTYKREVDECHTAEYKQDWPALAAFIARHGVRNAVLTAQFPSETSSQVSNATNGIEPPRSLVSVKQSKDGILRQVVPDIFGAGSMIETAWEMTDMTGYLDKVGIMQKFIGQAISANTYYDPRNYPGGKLPVRNVLKDIIHGYRRGLKTFYYHNTNDGTGEDLSALPNCESGACSL